MEIGRNFFALVAEAHTPALANGKVDLAVDFTVDAKSLKSAVFVAPAVGVPGDAVMTFAGTYLAGDTVRTTIVSNDAGRQLWRKSYLHTVLAGATSAANVAAAVNSLIAADGEFAETPYTSAVVGAVVTVTAKTDDKNALTVTEYTDSAAGTIAVVHNAPTISEGNPNDLEDKGVAASDINLAVYDTVRIEYNPKSAQPHIDSVGAVSKEIYWYGTPGEGANLVTLIDSL